MAFWRRDGRKEKKQSKHKHLSCLPLDQHHTDVMTPKPRSPLSGQKNPKEIEHA
jgi:hypothetical protein